MTNGNEDYLKAEQQIKVTYQSLPFLEEIYDMDTEDLQSILLRLDSVREIIALNNQHFPFLVEKYEVKLTRLRHCIELEINERK